MQNKSKTILLNDEQRRQQRRRQLRNWGILLGVIALVTIITVLIYFFSNRSESITAQSLPCYADQDVTVFQEGVLYYDGESLHYVNSDGGVEWSYNAGRNAQFSVSDTHIILWANQQLSIINEKGKSSFSRNMEDPIQFARIGSHHAAIVTGDELKPTVYVRDLEGTHVDFETTMYDGMFILDCGFYGKNDEYLWTLSYDFYAPVVTSQIHTFQVGSMTTGSITVDDHLVDEIIYVNNQLNVFTTQQMYTYDYRGVEVADSSKLVYGWEYLDHDIPKRDPANILLASTKQINEAGGITDLRVMSTSLDRRYTLPSACVGAAIDEGHIFAFSSNYLYSGTVDSQRFYAHAIPLPDGRIVTGFLGLTSDGHAIVLSNDEVYAVSLPK